MAVQNFIASEASSKLLEGQDRGQVFERLAVKKPYKPRKNVDEPSVNLVNDDETPKAQVTMHRGAPICVALYEINQ
jgi:hypothetical protein